MTIPPKQARLRSQGPGLALAMLAIGLALFLAYRPVLGGYFLSDDFGFIRIFHAKPLGDFPALFTGDWSGGLWGETMDELRPLVGLVYWVDGRLWGLNPAGYHATNLLFHGLSSLLVFAIARHLAGRGRGPALAAGLTAGLLFGLHPVHPEAVAWIAARVDLVSMFFYLGAFAAFVAYRSTGRGRYWLLALTVFGLALFSKETAITFPAMVIAYDLFYRRRPTASGPGTRRWLALPRAAIGGTPRNLRFRGDPIGQAVTHAPFLALLAGYLLIRRAAFESPLREENVTLDALLDFVSRQRFYFGELLLPINPLLDRLPLDAYSPPGQAALGTALLALLGGCGYWLWRNPPPKLGALRALLFFGLLWPLIATSPTIVADIPLSPRYLYLPTAGLAIAVAVALWALPWSGLASGNPGSGAATATVSPARRIARRAVEPADLARGLAAVALVAAAALALQGRNADWVAASRLSRAFTQEVESLVGDLPAGSRVILDVPATYGRAYLWGWGLPFALQEPFTSAGLYERFRVLELPDSYRCPPCWFAERQQAVAELLAEPDPVHILYIDGAGAVRRRAVDREEMQARLAAAAPPDAQAPPFEAIFALLDNLASESANPE